VIDRRAFLAGTGATLLLAPLAAEAQPARRPIIGVTLAGSLPNPYGEALRRALAELGWVDGQNVRIEYRYAEGRPERYPGFFAELLRLNVDVIVAGGGTVAAIAARRATRTIPIIVFVPDPVAAGLVASLARPGGNVTGLSMQIMEIGSKRLDLLKALLPKIERVAVLCDAADISEAGAIEATAPSLGSRMQVLRASRVEEFEGAVAAAKRARAEALIVCASGFFTAHRKRLVDLAAQYRLAAIYENRDFANAGGLMSYGPSIADMYRSAATYVAKILKGAKPADLPVEQPTKFEFVINLKTAKALGLTIPQSLLLRADEVIQ
jgi:putative tryptophan/tyrosine transport system substrate-binding protein